MPNSDSLNGLKDWWKPTETTKINRVRYKVISRKVYGLLKEFNIRSYPVDLDKVIYLLNKLGINIEVVSYSDYAKFKSVSMSHLIMNVFKSKDGATAYITEADLYIIYINDRMNPKVRINWTKAHEIGHIILNHSSIMEPVLLKRRGLTDKQYDTLEREAEWFAKLLICHPLILQKCGFDTSDIIMEICNISKRAAKNRLNEIVNPFNFHNEYDLFISMLFDNFINLKTCLKCKNRFFIAGATYCPVCGHSEFEKFGEVMIYSSIKLDENHKAIRCPKCDNEIIIHKDGEYCQICGVNLVNRCYGDNDCDYYGNYSGLIEGCKTLAGGDARYCHKCGKQTTFGYFGLLKDWEAERKSKNEINNSIPRFEEITSDDDLPF